EDGIRDFHVTGVQTCALPISLGFRCAGSGMTVACASRHDLDTSCEYTVESSVADDVAKTVFTVAARAGEPIHLTKYVAYHSSRRSEERRVGKGGRPVWSPSA